VSLTSNPRNRRIGFTIRFINKPIALLANGGLWYRAGDIELHLGIEDVNINSKRHPAFEVSDLEGARKWLQCQEVEIKDEIQIPGQHRFSFKDPFGNLIELLQKI
jgi:catechol 2,3-dioxygenase-like lactoylglutathione lyase family enzyme